MCQIERSLALMGLSFFVGYGFHPVSPKNLSGLGELGWNGEQMMICCRRNAKKSN